MGRKRGTQGPQCVHFILIKKVAQRKHMVVCEQESVSDRLAQQVLPKAVSRQRGKGAVKKQPVFLYSTSLDMEQVTLSSVYLKASNCQSPTLSPPPPPIPSSVSGIP